VPFKQQSSKGRQPRDGRSVCLRLASRFTRSHIELYRQQKSVVPCIREGEAASESLATAIDGGYLVEQLESWRWGGNPGQ
jgi:hypothetical protein